VEAIKTACPANGNILIANSTLQSDCKVNKKREMKDDFCAIFSKKVQKYTFL